MLSNYHTHSTYCDGKNTLEEILLYAIEKGCPSIGFSGHGYTPFDLKYCMKETRKYIDEISELKNKYGNRIEIYCGVEEDAFSYVNRNDFDYMIGSSHYIYKNDEYHPIDSNYEGFKKCLELYNFDVIKFSKDYYDAFVSYIHKRKPDIVGHFDLITKYDEMDIQYFLNNKEYLSLASNYLDKASDCDVIFEVNTGAMGRGIRKTPYLGEELLYILKKKGSKIILSSDSHSVDTLNFYFGEMEYILKNTGFKYVYELSKGEFVKRWI